MKCMLGMQSMHARMTIHTHMTILSNAWLLSQFGSCLRGLSSYGIPPFAVLDESVTSDCESPSVNALTMFSWMHLLFETCVMIPLSVNPQSTSQCWDFKPLRSSDLLFWLQFIILCFLLLFQVITIYLSCTTLTAWAGCGLANNHHLSHDGTHSVLRVCL